MQETRYELAVLELRTQALAKHLERAKCAAKDEVPSESVEFSTTSSLSDTVSKLGAVLVMIAEYLARAKRCDDLRRALKELEDAHERARPYLSDEDRRSQERTMLEATVWLADNC